MTMDAATTLEQGKALLAPLLEAQGFAYEPGPATRDETQEVARGAFTRADGRRLELTVVRVLVTDGAEVANARGVLRDVVYRVGELSVPHEAYMAVVLGEEGSNQYPTFGGHPLDGFRHLCHDMECYAMAFLRGPDAHFKVIADRAALWSRGMWSPRALFRT
ncbi:MAG: hypothetical protein ABR499_01595 [Gemmatimonadaceae bacterium]